MKFNFGTILISLVLIIVGCLAIYGMIIWLRRRRYTKERFAFAVLSNIVTLTFALFASLATNLMPWYVIAAIFQVISGQEIDVPEILWSEQVLLVVGYGIAIGGIIRLHGQWDGGKSVEQYNREQRSESSNLILEGLDELRRLVKREPALQLYSELDRRQFISPLEPVTESLAWKEQARELLRLSSSSYAFDSVFGWHDKQGCWVGTNVDTGDLVFLYPCQAALSNTELKTFVRYADRMAAEQNKPQAELIIAGKDEVPTSVTTWHGRTIRVETESTLLDHLVNFRDYENEIRKRVLALKLPDSNLILNDVYVPSRFYLSNVEKPSQNVEQYLRKWLSEPGQRQLALLGEYGQGKSTAAQMFTYHLLEQGPPRRIPILIDLRGMSPRNLTPLGLLGVWAARYRIAPQALMLLLRAGRLVLIFEGFDEMALVGDAEMRLKHFKTLWQFSYPQAKILITGRPNFFLDDQEMKAALGISKPLGDDKPYCEAIRLALFDVSQIKASLRAHKPLVREQICALAENNPRFRELISRPSLRHIVSVLWERESLSEKVEELNSAVVMALFVRHSYRRQGLKEADSPDFMVLTTLEREYFMIGVASYMAANQLPNQISGTELNQLIDALIEAIPDSVSTESSAMSGESTTPLWLRLEGTPDRVEQVKTDVRACGLLVDDPAVPGTFRFGHQSFMEYLFAAIVAERIQKESSEKARAVLKVTDAKIEEIFKLSVSLEFLVELIAADYKKRRHPIYLDPKTMRPADEKTVVSRLLQSISDDGMPFWPRFSAFNEAFWLSAKKHGMIWGVISYFICPLFLIEFAGVLALALIWYRYQSLDWWMWVIIFVLLTLFVTLNAMLARHIYRSREWKVRTQLRLKMRLWNLLCKDLGIPDNIQHRVVGTWLLPWAKNRPFDFFLANSQSNDHTE